MMPSPRGGWSAAAALISVLVLSGCVPVNDSSAVDSAAVASASPSAPPTGTADEADASVTEDSNSTSGGSGAGDNNAGSGSSNPGGSGSGSGGNSGSNGGSNSGSNSGGEATPSPPAPTAAPPPAASGPVASVINQRCASGKLTITLTANSDNSYRKGITSVLLERQNEFNAWIDSGATWLGPETGQGNQWTGGLPGNQQNIGKTLRVTVAGTTGSTTLTLPVSAPC